MAHRTSILEDWKAHLAAGIDRIRIPVAPRVIDQAIDVLNGRQPSSVDPNP
jgi:hypothetical protein